MTERLHFHFSLSCTGEGNGNPLQCSCLENLRDGGALWAAVYGIAQGRTRLKWLSSSSSSKSKHWQNICRLAESSNPNSPASALDLEDSFWGLQYMVNMVPPCPDWDRLLLVLSDVLLWNMTSSAGAISSWNPKRYLTLSHKAVFANVTNWPLPRTFAIYPCGDWTLCCSRCPFSTTPRGIQGGEWGTLLQGNSWNRSLRRYFQKMTSWSQSLQHFISRKSLNPFMVTSVPCD